MDSAGKNQMQMQMQSGVPVPPGYVAPPSGFMPAPSRPIGCPPGLEYLTQIDQVLIHQQIELAEVIFGLQFNNKYEIKNSLGQKIFFAAEENDFCNRCCCGPLRSFVIKIMDNFNQEVIEVRRPLRCGGFCCPCCPQELEVHAPPGTPIGYVVQDWHPFIPKFTIQNENREPVLKIQGPCCGCRCCADVNFKVLALDGISEVGMITKQWGGILREAYTNADNFGVQFPMDLDVKVKAVMLGACFLIDFMYFEHKQDR
ncbi:phospholipid scramblase 1-like isoform X2 [Polypterus senegalus]|uniref:phospholipid scramblase 1-like isoform X2 n=1 Tax=Polypterus senegalus TaxID=55291 RepID=UPI0019636CB9|nr:phospholipid scramblase 1-like isoform X2 [Polypterus senegalus]